ncbi:phage holin family protein [Paeniglutamicibacter sp. ANT13_2]|uniref:Phage holin family protein n=2 Tax=Paeniglutamicibacter terrestris TaxID=2723403 RepID=A0ABX1G1L8_9MICC|nr:phage holin family protein [Paeniglutamicibacter terrestris]
MGSMIAFLFRVVINALALAAATWIVPGITVTSAPSMDATLGVVLAYLVVGLVFGLVNAVVRPIVSLLSTPITCLTLGLFTLIINAAMLLLTSWLTQYLPIGLHVGTFFWDAVIGAVIISIVSALLGWFSPSKR